MISAIVSRDGIDVRGHSGYAPAGSDIVCAGVSALLNAFIDSAGRDVAVEEADAKTVIQIKTHTKETEAKFKMLVTGLKGIEDEFPEFVHIHDQAYMSLNGTIESSIETITR